MKKNIVLFLVVLVVLGGGWYMMNMNQSMDTNMSAENVDQASLKEEGQKVLVIDAAASKAMYEIDEDLRGKPTHVVGTSQALSGTVSINPETMMIEEAKISLDANSLKTDISMRDENVKKMVLKSDQPGNEAIVFNMTSVSGMPAQISMGQSMPIKITGDLMISGMKKSVTFDGTLEFMTDGSIKVLASTVLTYGDFGIAVPDLPFLANVAKTTKITVDLVAR